MNLESSPGLVREGIRVLQHLEEEILVLSSWSAI